MLQELNARANQQGGHIEVLTSLAAGADLELADVASDLQIPLHVILPTPAQDFHKDFEGDDASWSRVTKYIDMTTAGQLGSTIRVSQGSSERPDCYHETNIQILQSCDLLLAVWDGQPENGIGGTAEAIAYARRASMPLIMVNPVNRDVTNEGNIENWPKSDSLVEDLNKSLDTQETTADAIFKELDRTATEGGKRFRGRLVLAMALHFAAALLAATTASFTPVMLHSSEETVAGVVEPVTEDAPADKEHAHEGNPLLPKVMTAIELLLVSIAWYIMWKAHHGNLHTLWRKNRFATEVGRGLLATSGLLDPLDPLLVRHAPEWRRFSVSFALLADRENPSSLSMEDLKSSYIEKRLVAQAQSHFAKKLPIAKRLSHRLSAIATFASYSAPIFIFIALGAKVLDVKHLASSSYLLAAIIFWLPVVLPLLAGSAISFVVATDSARRAERYQLMIDRLNIATQNLVSLKTPGAVSRSVAIAEDIMIDELIEWYVASKNVGH